jgi:hypothetical protein
MNKEQRLRRLKAMVGAQKIVSQSQQDKRYVIEVPGYSLRRSTRSSSPHEAINQMVQEWVRDGSLIPSNISEPLRVKLTDFSTKESTEFQLPIEQAMSGSTSYPLPNFGGYDEEPAELGPNVEEHERQSYPVGEDEQAKRDGATGLIEGMEFVEPNFSQPKVFMHDPTGAFQPSDINELLFRASNKNWITIPDEARRNGIPNLYHTVNPTEYDKYFGLKTEYGYVHTFASALLQHMVKRGIGNRGDLSKRNKLTVPEDYPLHGQIGDYLITLPIEIETALIREAYTILKDSNRKPSNIRKLQYNRDGSLTYTTSFTNSNIRTTDPMGQFTPEMEQRLRVLDRAASKPISDYRRLNALVQDFVGKLDSKMTLLLKEQHSVNSSSRFLRPSGKREDVDDVLKQVILRKVVSAIQGSETFDVNGEELKSPLEGTEMEEMDYTIPN